MICLNIKASVTNCNKKDLISLISFAYDAELFCLMKRIKLLWVE